MRTNSLSGVSAGSDESEYFVGAFSSLGHSISSHTSSLGGARWTCFSAVCTRTAANREDCAPRLPSRRIRPADAVPERLKTDEGYARRGARART
jgi:hypothetical protein